jgi:hypothetical protein
MQASRAVEIVAMKNGISRMFCVVELVGALLVAAVPLAGCSGGASTSSSGSGGSTLTQLQKATDGVQALQGWYNT